MQVDRPDISEKRRMRAFLFIIKTKNSKMAAEYFKSYRPPILQFLIHRKLILKPEDAG